MLNCPHEQHTRPIGNDSHRLFTTPSAQRRGTITGHRHSCQCERRPQQCPVIAAGYFKDYAIERDRPSLEFLGSEFPIDPEADTGTLGGKGSYPSGHSARASVVAFVIGYVISERYPNGWKLLWLFPIVVGISRIYLLQHYPLDVVGGILFGLIIANILSLKLKLPILPSKSET